VIPLKCTGVHTPNQMTGRHLMKFMVLVKEERDIRVWECETCPRMYVEFVKDNRG
jgi:hypothetical protein